MTSEKSSARIEAVDTSKGLMLRVYMERNGAEYGAACLFADNFTAEVIAEHLVEFGESVRRSAKQIVPTPEHC